MILFNQNDLGIQIWYYNLTRKQNVFIAKINIANYIWKSANLDGIEVTYPET